MCKGDARYTEGNGENWVWTFPILIQFQNSSYLSSVHDLVHPVNPAADLLGTTASYSYMLMIIVHLVVEDLVLVQCRLVAAGQEAPVKIADEIGPGLR